jgi:uncharacterized protein
MRVRDILIGPTGLRAGCRLLIFLGLVVALQAGFQEIVLLILRARRVVVPGGLNATVFIIADTITLIGVLIASGLMAKWEHRKLADYGLPGKNAFGWRFWEGALVRIRWRLSFDPTDFSGGRLFARLAGAARGAAAEGYSAAAAGVACHRICGRVFVPRLSAIHFGARDGFLARGIPDFTSVRSASLLHEAYERWPDWASTGLLALLICLTLRRTGDLRFAVGFHAAFDFGAIFVYSGPNGGQFAPDRLLTATFHGGDWLTGGKLGPEASRLVFPVIAAMFLAFHWLYPAAAKT